MGLGERGVHQEHPRKTAGRRPRRQNEAGARVADVGQLQPVEVGHAVALVGQPQAVGVRLGDERPGPAGGVVGVAAQHARVRQVASVLVARGDGRGDALAVRAGVVVQLEVQEGGLRVQVHYRERQILAAGKVDQVERLVGQSRRAGPVRDAAQGAPAGHRQDVILAQGDVVDRVQFHIAQRVDAVCVSHGAARVGDAQGQLVVVGEAHQYVGAMITVEVFRLEGAGTVEEKNLLARARAERSARLGFPHGDRLVALQRQAQVAAAVAVEVGRLDVHRLGARDGILVPAETAAAGVPKHRDRVPAGVGHRHIQVQVAVEITAGQRHGAASGGVRGAAGERIAEQQVERVARLVGV